ncbi:MAG TPA: hypothetical protein PKC65_10900 [Pyrinomonadaceae bacterium]|nr:hypothetical protein [Pyrinomonadaceae bacterium]
MRQWLPLLNTDSIRMRRLFYNLLALFSIAFSFSASVHGQRPTKALVDQLLRDDSNAADIVRNSGYSTSDVIKQLTAKAVDLDGDGLAEFILSGLICGQNCSHWIYRKRRNLFEQIPFEGSFLELKVLATSTNGFRDLRASIFLNCCEGGLETYQYNGSEYKPTICKIEKYGYTDKRGVYRKYKYPRIEDCE